MGSSPSTRLRSPVAQLVECLLYKKNVAGSIPARTTKYRGRFSDPMVIKNGLKMDDSLHNLHLIAGKYYGEEKTCSNKIDYKSLETAEKAGLKMTKKTSKNLEAYPCYFCKGWHIGRKLTQEEIEFFSDKSF